MENAIWLGQLSTNMNISTTQYEAKKAAGTMTETVNVQDSIQLT